MKWKKKSIHSDRFSQAQFPILFEALIKRRNIFKKKPEFCRLIYSVKKIIGSLVLRRYK